MKAKTCAALRSGESMLPAPDLALPGAAYDTRLRVVWLWPVRFNVRSELDLRNNCDLAGDRCAVNELP